MKRVLVLRRFLLKAPGKIVILGKLSKVFQCFQNMKYWLFDLVCFPVGYSCFGSTFVFPQVRRKFKRVFKGLFQVWRILYKTAANARLLGCFSFSVFCCQVCHETLFPRIISKNDLGRGLRSSYWNVEMSFTKNNKRRDENLNKNMFFSCLTQIYLLDNVCCCFSLI